MFKLARLHYTGTRPTGAGGQLLSFRSHSPIRFLAGQHGLWLVPSGGMTPFSIASAPSDEAIELATVLHGGSRRKRALAALQPGDAVRFLGPLGNLAPSQDGRPIVLVAQGIGITAVRSILREPSDARRTLLHVGAHHFREETEALADQALFPEDRGTFADQLAQIATAQPEAHFLLTGSRAFVRDTARWLRDAGIPAARIRRDPFYGMRERQDRAQMAAAI